MIGLLVFYAAIVSFELELGGPRLEKNSDLELVGGRDNRYNNERNKRAFHSAAVSKESINDNYNTTCRVASYYLLQASGVDLRWMI